MLFDKDIFDRPYVPSPRDEQTRRDVRTTGHFQVVTDYAGAYPYPFRQDEVFKGRLYRRTAYSPVRGLPEEVLAPTHATSFYQRDDGTSVRVTAYDSHDVEKDADIRHHNVRLFAQNGNMISDRDYEVLLDDADNIQGFIPQGMYNVFDVNGQLTAQHFYRDGHEVDLDATPEISAAIAFYNKTILRP